MYFEKSERGRTLEINNASGTINSTESKTEKKKSIHNFNLG
jgi:hypothetical protein